jgi:hypothetical protein
MDACRGLNAHLGITNIMQAQYLQNETAAIEGEFRAAAAANPEDWDNFRKVRDGRYIGHNQKTLDQLLQHQDARVAGLLRHHVLALRLYTTESHRCINPPMRLDPPTKPHPFAATTYFINEGIRRLQTVHAQKGNVLQERIFWRGVADQGLDENFFQQGGTEFACSSTSLEKGVAFGFAGAECPLLLKFKTNGILNLGADVSFLSVYPTECEMLYPPLTYLKPLSSPVRELYHGTTVLVAEVEPTLAAN